MNYEEYVPLEDLNETETTEIMGALSEQEIDVKIDADGNITVPAGQEAQIRMDLATAGYPKNGLSYYVIEDNEQYAVHWLRAKTIWKYAITGTDRGQY